MGSKAGIAVPRHDRRVTSKHKAGQHEKDSFLCEGSSEVLETVSRYAPNLQSLILDRQVLTPLDWEQTYGLTEGSIHHGQMSLDQLLIMRPISGWSRYRTPVENLFLCGAGTHPGGGVSGAPGYNAAREAIKMLKGNT